jgi:predicted nuclease with TOPRIM domain
MAKPRSTTKQNDILARFTELGHEALNRLSEVPGGSRVVEMMNDSKTRLDEMQKKLRGLDELEKRVARLEKQLAATAKKPAARKPVTVKPKPVTPKKPPA